MRSEELPRHHQHQHNSSSSSRADSPPPSDVWSTERRLTEKAPPGAPPRKRHGRRSSMPHSNSGALEDVIEHSSSKRQNMIQHSSPIIDEDTETSELILSLPEQPPRLVFDNEVVAKQQDPTTVLLLPQAAAPWEGEMDMDEDEEEEADDFILSPRLFGSYRRPFFEQSAAVDDRNDAIFRQTYDDEEDREGLARHSSWSPAMRRDDAEDRVA